MLDDKMVLLTLKYLDIQHALTIATTHLTNT